MENGPTFALPFERRGRSLRGSKIRGSEKIFEKRFGEKKKALTFAAP